MIIFPLPKLKEAGLTTGITYANDVITQSVAATSGGAGQYRPAVMGERGGRREKERGEWSGGRHKERGRERGMDRVKE